MTGKSHVVVNSALTYALFGSPELSVVAAVAAKLPDQMEIFLPGIPHRTVTHVMAFWFFLSLYLGVGLMCPWVSLFSWEGSNDLRLVLFGLALGGLLHVVADFFSISGVPILRFGHGFGLKWYTTGTLSELLMLIGVVVAAGLFIATKQSFMPARLLQ